jgi:hypothetical protein
LFYIVLAKQKHNNKIRETAMSKNTNQMMLFKEISSKNIEVDFNGGEVSTDAGLLFLREIESQVGIINKVAAVIHDRRHPGYVKHQIVELLTQRIFQIAAGYEDANDSNTLKHDPIFKIACEKDDVLASQSTMCRFENATTRTTLYRIGEVLLDIFINSYEKPPKSIIIDVDDTDDPTHGNQQLSLFNAYHDCYCYMPLHIYEGSSGKLITTILRPGKRPSGKEIVSVLKRVIRKIRKVWPHVGIILRGDSHFSAPAVYDFCDDYNIKYVLGFKSYKPLLHKAENLMTNARQLYKHSGKPVKIYSEFYYQAASWSAHKRIICKAEYNDKGANTRFIITNLEHAKYKFIYETVYCGRGAMELFIKEHKNHLYSDRTSCVGFHANQFRLFLHSIAYVLMHTFREKHLKKTEFARAQFNTIRLKLLKIGARVVELTTKIKIHLPSSYPLKNEFAQIRLSLYAARYS